MDRPLGVGAGLDAGNDQVAKRRVLRHQGLRLEHVARVAAGDGTTEDQIVGHLRHSCIDGGVAFERL